MSPESWVTLALAGKCPRCGKGKLFSGFLTVAESCDVCNLDLAKADSGDGPAVFVMFVVGFVVVAVAFWWQMTFAPPVWLLLAGLTVLTVGLSLVLLRPFKAALIILQFRNDAAEGRTLD